MLTLRGIPVSPGFAIGTALVLNADGAQVAQQRVDAKAVEREIQRLHNALASAAFEATQAQRDITQKLGAKYGAIFAAHALFFEDPAILHDVETLIRHERFTADYAVSRVLNEFAKTIEDMGEESFLAWRSADLYDIEKRILKHLLGVRHEPLKNISKPAIILARDLTPSETASLDRHMVLGFATEHGGRTSHTAIIANAMDLPAIVGLPALFDHVTTGDELILDGFTGQLLINPDTATIERYKKSRDERMAKAGYLVAERHLPAQTKDGVKIAILGNIEFPHEATSCTARGAAGVGLYRTEFLYLGRATDPTEDEHFQAYLRVLHEMTDNHPVVIRTLDLGADKFAAAHAPREPEKNPTLGLRSVRLCLKDLPLFRTQLRAILRASAFGNVHIMFPMVSTLWELRQCIFLLNDVKEDLREEGIKFNPQLPIGTMIEVPSAAIMADVLAREVDFFSLGTNDLIQYTLAADRTNEHVADLYSAADPAVLRLIQMVVKAANEHGKGVNVCGEMSGDPLFTPVLVGMGLRQLSLTPNNLPAVKAVIRRLDMADAQRIAADVLAMASARDIQNYLLRQRLRIDPEAANGREE